MAGTVTALVQLLLAFATLATRLKDTMAMDVDSWQSGRGYSYNVTELEGTCFEEYWYQLPKLQAVDDAIAVDGFSFQSRMSVIKFLIEFDSSPLLLWGSSKLREYHWLWGYGAQLDWQHRSGRLTVSSEKGFSTNASAPFPDTIDPNSWWGYMNFCFSIAIFVGGKESGVLDSMFPENTHLQLDQVSQQLVNHNEGVQKSINAWKNLFENGYAQYRDKVQGGQLSDKELKQARYQFRKQVWEAHTAVINAAMNPYSDELLAKMPLAERKFGAGWATMVELLAASAFPTDLVSLVQDGAGFLPIQVVTDEIWKHWKDDPESFSLLDRRRMNAVESCHKLLGMPAQQLQFATAFWKRVTRNDRISRSVPKTIFELIHGSPLAKARQMIRVLCLFVQPREWIATAIVILLGGTLLLPPNSSFASFSNLPWFQKLVTKK